MAVTAGAVRRLFPWIITFFFEKFLEFDRKKDYHFSVPCGLGKPTFFARAALWVFGLAALAFQNKKGLKTETHLF